MSVDGKVKYLTETINEQIESFGKLRIINKGKAFWFKMLITSSSAATTILLGLQGLEHWTLLPPLVKNLALLLSALVTLFSTWDTFFNHKALWVRYTLTLSQLKGIRAELEYLSSNGSQDLKEEDVDLLFRKYQSVIQETNSAWLSLRGDSSHRKATE
jgi:hypothetical protein